MGEARFKKGQRVTFRMGMREVHGVVKEDRGQIGVNGRRLYAVEFPMVMCDPDRSVVELPADQLAPISNAVGS